MLWGGPEGERNGETSNMNMNEEDKAKESFSSPAAREATMIEGNLPHREIA
jgi:hypothetical protein